MHTCTRMHTCTHAHAHTGAVVRLLIAWLLGRLASGTFKHGLRLYELTHNPGQKRHLPAEWERLPTYQVSKIRYTTYD